MQRRHALRALAGCNALGDGSDRDAASERTVSLVRLDERQEVVVTARSAADVTVTAGPMTDGTTSA